MIRLVRRLEAGDLKPLLRLYEHLHREDAPLPDFETVASTWQQFLSEDRFFCFGAYADSELVSSCTLAIVPNLTRGCRPFGVIENVVTHDGHRGKGWGKLVLAHALDEAWARRCHKVELSTGRKDDAIVRFYESAGFDSSARKAFVARAAPAG
jgi:GNAT superfamily N-acetyltransferase